MSRIHRTLSKGAVPFAHLLGIRAESEDKEDEDTREKRAEWKEKAEKDDERKRRDDESDGEYVKRMKAMDEEEEEKDEDRKEEEDENDEEKEDKKARADDPDDEPVARERARCARIIAYGLKNGCVHQAGAFAFDTNLTAAQAIAALKAGAMDKGRSSLGERMAGMSVPRVGSDAAARDSGTPQQQAAAAILRAGARARGEA
jgi:hypothetical protein